MSKVHMTNHLYVSRVSPGHHIFIEPTTPTFPTQIFEDHSELQDVQCKVWYPRKERVKPFRRIRYYHLDVTNAAFEFQKFFGYVE